MSDEIWKPVAGHKGAYEVSDLGRVRSLSRYILRRRGRGKTPDAISRVWLPGKMLRPGIASNGYLTVSLVRRSHCVHVLVLTAFVGPSPSGQEVLHRNGDRLDNRPDNLRWGTRKENIADLDLHGTSVRGEQRHNAKLNAAAVLKIRELQGKVPQSGLAAMFGVSPAAIQAVHDGRTWKHIEAAQ